MRICLLVLTLLVGVSPAAAQDDLLAAGKFEFFRCSGCHNATATGPAKKGPHLHNLFGRKPGSLPNFNYSEAMVAFGQDKVWDATTLATFLRDPGGTVPGNKMIAGEFQGMEKEEEVQALIAYLETLDPDGMAPQ
jgi:cytochrome c